MQEAKEMIGMKQTKVRMRMERIKESEKEKKRSEVT